MRMKASGTPPPHPSVSPVFPLALLLIYARHECLGVRVCGLNLYERLPGGGTTGAKSLICAGGLRINSPRRLVLRQSA